jgi:hypothetical protein
MKRRTDGTQITLTIDHGRWDFIVELGCLGLAKLSLALIVVGLIRAYGFGVSTWGLGSLFLIALFVAGIIGFGFGWREGDAQRDAETSDLLDLICATLGAEVIESSSNSDATALAPTTADH